MLGISSWSTAASNPLGLAYDAALAVGGDRVVDAMILPHAHPALGAALGGTLMTRCDEGRGHPVGRDRDALEHVS